MFKEHYGPLKLQDPNVFFNDYEQFSYRLSYCQRSPFSGFYARHDRPIFTLSLKYTEAMNEKSGIINQNINVAGWC